MADIIHFKARHALDALKNLSDFIGLSKNELTVFGSDLEWGSWRWPKVANFTKVGVHSRGVNPDKDLLASEFMDFAKAYFRYQQGHKPTVAKNEMRALRCLEQALLKNFQLADVSKTSISTLDEAAMVARQFYENTAAYHAGREIERLAKFLNDKGLVSVKLDTWKNPIKRANDRVNTGQKAKEDRQKKLPSSDVLEAMAEIFASNPENPKDIFTSSVFAMLLCAPSRISEILILPIDCEIEEKDSQGETQYGWRFYSAKGFGGDIKWIPKVMVPIAKEAILRIKKLTALDRERLIDSGKDYLADPKTGLMLSKALFCMSKGLTHAQNKDMDEFWIPTNNAFNRDLGPRKVKYHKSIFDRYGYKDSNGNSLKATSHQVRHLIDTIAERGGLAQDELAKWAGRADAKQNRVYNQMSEYEMVVRAEQFDPSKSLFGPVGAAKKHIPITIQEFNTLEKGAAHVTEYGFCIHDYTISPCEKYRDCLNCSEQVCIKGEDEKLKRVKAQLAEVEEQFKAAEVSMKEGLAGADRWYEYHQHTRNHLRQLIEILEDSNLPDGSIIKLSNDKSFSQTNRVLQNKHGDNRLKQEQKKLEQEALALMGGGLG